MPKAPISKLLCSSESARYLGVTRQTLYNWRHEGKGPRWLDFHGDGKVIRYRRSDLEAFLEHARSNADRMLTGGGETQQGRALR